MIYWSGEDVDGDILLESTDMDVELDSGILNDTETMKEGFRAAIVNFKDEVLKRIDEDPLYYSKCVKSFTKQLKTMSTWNHRLFQKALFSFSDDKTCQQKKVVKETYPYKKLQNHVDSDY